MWVTQYYYYWISLLHHYLKILSTVKAFSSTVMQPCSPPLILGGPSDKSPVNTDRLTHQVLTVESFHGCLGFFVCLILHQCISLSTVTVNMIYIFKVTLLTHFCSYATGLLLQNVFWMQYCHLVLKWEGTVNSTQYAPSTAYRTIIMCNSRHTTLYRWLTSSYLRTLVVKCHIYWQQKFCTIKRTLTHSQLDERKIYVYVPDIKIPIFKT